MDLCLFGGYHITFVNATSLSEQQKLDDNALHISMALSFPQVSSMHKNLMQKITTRYIWMHFKRKCSMWV